MFQLQGPITSSETYHSKWFRHDSLEFPNIKHCLYSSSESHHAKCFLQPHLQPKDSPQQQNLYLHQNLKATQSPLLYMRLRVLRANTKIDLCSCYSSKKYSCSQDNPAFCMQQAHLKEEEERSFRSVDSVQVCT